jgi:NAD-dependent SIR2 family protein deacetylase
MGGPAYCVLHDGDAPIQIDEADNFALVSTPVMLPTGERLVFPSSEAAYQASKYLSPDTGLPVDAAREAIESLQSEQDGEAAWRIGQDKSLRRRDWDIVKVSCMLRVCRAKGAALTDVLASLNAPPGAYIFVPYTFPFWGTPSGADARSRKPGVGAHGRLAGSNQVPSSDPRLRVNHRGERELNWNGRIQMILRESELQRAGRSHDPVLLYMLLEDVAAFAEKAQRACAPACVGADTLQIVAAARREADEAREAATSCLLAQPDVCTVVDRSVLFSLHVLGGTLREAAAQYLPWTCATCTFENTSFPSICEGCDSANPNYRIQPARATRASVENRLLSRDEDRLAAFASRVASGASVSLLFGAGVSTACGVPDFRSPGGLYDTLRPDKLTATEQQREWMTQDPTAVVNKELFMENPLPYHEVRRPFIIGTFEGKWRPTLAHAFARALCARGQLKHLYTQNIDGLERPLDFPPGAVVNVHGSIAEAECEACGRAAELSSYIAAVRAQIKNIYDPADGPPSSTPIVCAGCSAIAVKPATVLFGGNLPELFSTATEADFGSPAGVDMLIVAGTSLKVFPAASIVKSANKMPRLVINRSTSLLSSRLVSPGLALAGCLSCLAGSRWARTWDSTRPLRKATACSPRTPTRGSWNLGGGAGCWRR